MHTDPAAAKIVEALGMKYVGIVAEKVGFVQTRSDAWLDADRVTVLRAHVASTRAYAADPTNSVELSFPTYFLATYFEDGSCVLTWSHQPKTASTKHLASRTGKGNISASVKDHQAFSLRWAAERKTRPLEIDRASVIVELVRYYYAYLVPLDLLLNFVVVLTASALTILFISVVFLLHLLGVL